MEEFDGRVAVVTGAASGIGRAIALRLHSEGMRLVLADIDADALDAVLRQIADLGGEAIGVKTDVSLRGDLEDLAAAAFERFGAVHLLCNNAGVSASHAGPIWEASDSDWQRVMGVNLGGVVNGVAVFLPMLESQADEAYIVNTASTTGLVEGADVYNVSKHAVISYTEALYSDLMRHKLNIGVSVLCPGFANTALLDESGDSSEGSRPAKDMATMFARLSLKMAMSPEVVADALVQGVRRRQFYILTDREWDTLIRARAENVIAGQSPNLKPGTTFQSRWPWPRPARRSREE